MFTGKADRLASVGETFYANVNGQRVRAIAGNEINSTNVVLVLGDDGQYYGWSGSSPVLRDSITKYYSNTLNFPIKTKLIYKIYYLLRCEETINYSPVCLYYRNWIPATISTLGDKGFTYISDLVPECDRNTLPNFQQAQDHYHNEIGYPPDTIYSDPEPYSTYEDIFSETITLEPDSGGLISGNNRYYQWVLPDDFSEHHKYKLEFTVSGTITTYHYRRTFQFTEINTTEYTVENNFAGNRVSHSGDATNYNYPGARFAINRSYYFNGQNFDQFIVWENTDLLPANDTGSIASIGETKILIIPPIDFGIDPPYPAYISGSLFTWLIHREEEANYHNPTPPPNYSETSITLDNVTTYTGGFTINFKLQKINNIVLPLPTEKIENKAAVFYLFSPIEGGNYKIKKLIEYHYTEYYESHIAVSENEEVFVTIKAGYNIYPENTTQLNNFRRVDFFKFVDGTPEIFEHQTFNYNQSINNIYPEDPLSDFHNYTYSRYSQLTDDVLEAQDNYWNYSNKLKKYITVRVGDESFDNIGLYPIIAINLLSTGVSSTKFLSVDYENQYYPYFWMPGDNYDILDNFRPIPRLIPENSEFSYLLNPLIAPPNKMEITPFILVLEEKS